MHPEEKGRIGNDRPFLHVRFRSASCQADPDTRLFLRERPTDQQRPYFECENLHDGFLGGFVADFLRFLRNVQLAHSEFYARSMQDDRLRYAGRS